MENEKRVNVELTLDELGLLQWFTQKEIDNHIGSKSELAEIKALLTKLNAAEKER